MGVTLNNTGASGSVNITMNFVLAYAISQSNKYAVKSIPAKVTPTVDTDTFIKNPTKYTIRARITDANKVTLTTLNGEENKQCKLTDGELSNKNVRPESINFDAEVGNTEFPWIVRIVLIAEDH